MVKKKRPMKRKTPTTLDLRTNTMRAHTISRALTALLAITTEQAQHGMPDIVEAVKALRTIANTSDNNAEPSAMWMRGIARGALKRMNVSWATFVTPRVKS